MRIHGFAVTVLTRRMVSWSLGKPGKAGMSSRVDVVKGVLPFQLRFVGCAWKLMMVLEKASRGMP